MHRYPRMENKNCIGNANDTVVNIQQSFYTFCEHAAKLHLIRTFATYGEHYVKLMLVFNNELKWVKEIAYYIEPLCPEIQKYLKQKCFSNSCLKMKLFENLRFDFIVF